MAVKTIILKGDGIRKEAPVKAAVTIQPGMLLERDGSDVKPHAGAGLRHNRLFAFENELAGKGITDTYAAAEQCLFVAAVPGMEIFAVLDESQIIAQGDYLESSGDGRLRKVTVDVATDDTQRGSLVGQALEAVTTGAAAFDNIQVELV